MDAQTNEEHRSRDQHAGDLVYGASHSARGLVFIPKSAAAKLASTYEALSSATWGELRSKATPGLLQEVLSMMGFEGRPPSDESPFDIYDIPAVNDGDWPEWPEQLMLSWIPREILSEYGQRENSLLNGAFAVLEETREQEIVAAFGRLGHRCVRDDELIARCCGT